MRGRAGHAGAADRDLEAVISVVVFAPEPELQIVEQRIGRGTMLLRERRRVKHDACAATTADMYPLMLGQVEQARAPDVVFVSHPKNVGGALFLEKLPPTDTAIFSRLLYKVVKMSRCGRGGELQNEENGPGRHCQGNQI
jgi:hypothetical protein